MGKHEHDCNCGCEEETVTLTLDNDEEIECAVIGIYEVDGKNYIALLPPEDTEDGAQGMVYLYRFIETEDGEPTLENIVDDDEFEAASEGFDEMLDSMDFEELEDEE